MAKYAYHRLDANHKAIVAGLRQRGASVHSGGPLDVIVGLGGATYLLEIKTARGRLRASQAAFLDSWRGQACVVRTLEEALAAIGCHGGRGKSGR